jgi:hypothetical protein
VPWWLLVVGLEFPVVMALLDCANRPPEDFAGGADDRRSWLRWLAVAVATAPLLVGYGIVLAYYWAVIRRNRSASF